MEVTPANLITCHQVHSPTCVVVEEPWTPETAPKADAMATRQSGIALGILTADCAPVLFADSKARVIGAAHAGWKGAKGGVIEATVARMVELGAKPNRIVACIGPCIAQRSYEVGPEFPTRSRRRTRATATTSPPRASPAISCSIWRPTSPAGWATPASR